MQEGLVSLVLGVQAWKELQELEVDILS